MVVPITEVAKGILRIGPLETGHPGDATSPYLLLGSKTAMVVEPGEDPQLPGVIDAIKACNVRLDGVGYVWASHIHFHHVQVLPKLLKQLPKAKFLVHPRGAPHLIEPTRLIQSTIEVWGDKCYGPFEAIPRDKVMPVEDNQTVDIGGKVLQIIHAPGHAPHHMGLFDQQTKALWFGDTMVPGIPGNPRGHHDIRPPLFDIEKFIETLHRYQALKPSVILTFSAAGVSFSPEETLRYAEEDIRAIERICLEGMTQKQSYKEISKKVDAYEDGVGVRPTYPSRRSRSVEFSSAGLFGMINYLKRKHPELAMPSDATKELWRERGDRE